MTDADTNKDNAPLQAQADTNNADGAQNNTSDAACENSDNTQALNDEIKALKQQRDDYKDKFARANAELYNATARIEKEAQKAKDFAIEKFAKDLLDIVDNLERAIDASEDKDSSITQGVVLTHKNLLNTLNKHGVTVIAPKVGETFNPEVHEAVTLVADANKDEVAAVLNKGYVLNGRVLRAAVVTVGQ